MGKVGSSTEGGMKGMILRIYFIFSFLIFLVQLGFFGDIFVPASLFFADSYL
jgi:hypothetical protein